MNKGFWSDQENTTPFTPGCLRRLWFAFLPGYLWRRKTPHKLPTVRTHILEHKYISSGSYQSVWGPQKQQQMVIEALKSVCTWHQVRSPNPARTQIMHACSSCVHIRLHLSAEPIPPLPPNNIRWKCLGPYIVLMSLRPYSLSFQV